MTITGRKADMVFLDEATNLCSEIAPSASAASSALPGYEEVRWYSGFHVPQSGRGLSSASTHVQPKYDMTLDPKVVEQMKNWALDFGKRLEEEEKIERAEMERLAAEREAKEEAAAAARESARLAAEAAERAELEAIPTFGMF